VLFVTIHLIVTLPAKKIVYLICYVYCPCCRHLTYDLLVHIQFGNIRRNISSLEFSRKYQHRFISSDTDRKNAVVVITIRYGLDGPGSNPGRCKIFRNRSGRPGYHRVIHGVIAAGTWRWPPTPSSAEVKETVELYLYSPVWAFFTCSRVNCTFYSHWKWSVNVVSCLLIIKITQICTCILLHDQYFLSLAAATRRRAFVGRLVAKFYRISEQLGRDKMYQLGKIIPVHSHYLLPIILHRGAAEWSHCAITDYQETKHQWKIAVCLLVFIFFKSDRRRKLYERV